MPKKSTDDLIQAAADAAGSGAPSNVPLYMPNEEHPPDTPIWRKEYSYRGGPYRYLNHQRGLIGFLKVRVVAARDLYKSVPGGSRQNPPDVSPQVAVKFLDNTMRSAIAAHNSDPTWRKEEMIFECAKGVIHDGAQVFLHVEVIDTQALGVAASLRRTRPTSLGQGSLAISALIKGEDGHAVMDAWVELSTGARVNLIIEYEPNGKEPEVNDVVYLEAFARQPRSLILPPNEPFIVKEIAGNYLLVSFLLPSARETERLADETSMGRIKIHRNTIFVIERRTVMDGIWNTALKPADMVLSTGAGARAKRALLPYMSYGRVLLTPVIVSFQVAIGAARLAARSALAGVSEATNTALGTRQGHRF